MVRNNNIIQFDSNRKWYFRRLLLKNAKKRLTQKLALQIKNKAANDNMDLKACTTEDLLKIY
ncbi:MAG: hypothetical protein CFH06_00939 [Alphaproteobacteria bacterium MarineAlpha3_Bin5]|nr:hypothetical protein [Magnetovibrio sp.]PPR78137.1 MAG: hypothetical protein CFH06_00939 [Alphaproteobacteria bacterium MarineAlpha3_Bin5]|tara:strand:+ start:36 stop:221 length:186 start_codon:yes stop_codon:yes gene_type:complete